MKGVVNFKKTMGGMIRVEIHFESTENEYVTNYLLKNDSGGSEYSCFDEFKNPEDAKDYAKEKIEEGRKEYNTIIQKAVPENYIVYL